MTGHRNFKELSDKLRSTPEGRVASERAELVMKTAVAFEELRRSRGMTQKDVAVALDVSQANISQMESKVDVYLSTLRKYVEALGGHLDLAAVFPDKTILLDLPKKSIDKDAA